MQVAILVFDGMTALDAVGPYESLRRLPDVRVVFVASAAGQPISAEGGGFKILPGARISEVRAPDVLIIPGGSKAGIKQLLSDPQVLPWLRMAHQTTRWTASVCTGAMILGAAGLLTGLAVATHWRAREYLGLFGATYSGERISEHGKLITCAGVSAGIDMGLRLCELISGREAAQAAQLSLEYDPAPPFDTGSLIKAPPAVVELALNRLSA